ncbi:hypothetical protein HYW83_03825 [Candidatus Peregrinibacteria bacterium]|nr:hypothetical protein [Candidatus Peregrinibacteria bacterium]
MHPIPNILRITAGLALLMIGIIGLLLPVLQGWLFIFIAIPLISPEHGKKMVAKLKEWINKYVIRRRNPDRQP